MNDIVIFKSEPYPTDLTDIEWADVSKEFPSLLEVKHARRYIEAFIYKYSQNARWINLPRDFPYAEDLKEVFDKWKFQGLISKVFSYLLTNYGLSTTLKNALINQGIMICHLPRLAPGLESEGVTVRYADTLV